MAYKTTEVEKYNVAKTVWDWLKKEHQNDQFDEFENFEEFFQDALTIELTGEHNASEDDNSDEVVIIRIAGREIFTGFNFLKNEISGEPDNPINKVEEPEKPEEEK